MQMQDVRRELFGTSRAAATTTPSGPYAMAPATTPPLPGTGAGGASSGADRPYDAYEAQKAKLQMLKTEINVKQDATVESTTRTLRMMEETKDTGTVTLGKMDEQTDKLNMVRSDMEEINANLHKAEPILNRIQARMCCCLCCCACCPKKSTFEQREEFKKAGFGGSAIHMNVSADTDKSGNVKVPNLMAPGTQVMISPTGGKYTTAGDCVIVEGDHREEIINKNIRDIGHLAGDLKEQALQMNTTLKLHKSQIDDLNAKGDSNLLRTNEVKIQTSKLAARA
eukprot:gnl/Spiro4/16742_TR9013_c0_g1_i1.p1 gnl/Spiro4/16742_TR9013_c0_g1~~gnl/Spiro4/16742_TR9013_c0_g1_i1.p1  ORF type:complete len:282 (+),score=70.68 gnl/Spiro4/16742_TR9013_c0_g1_i1:114-959(+)